MAARSTYLKTLIERMRLLPAVDKTSFAESVPPDGGYMLRSLEADNGNRLGGRQLTAMNTVSPEYFDVIGLRLVQGRTFSASPSPRDLIVNEGIARKLWPAENAVGKRVRFATAPGAAPLPWNTVVGVAENMPVHGPSADPAAPMFYSPVTDSSGFISQPMRIAVRSRPGVDPTAALRSLVMSLDTRAAPPKVESVSAALRDSISRQRFTMNLLAAFAVLAVILSAVGLYGVISYTVTQRTREIGIRIALGAMPAQAVRTIAARGLVLATLGLGAGLGAAVWGTKLIRSALFGVSGTDALSYAITGVALLAVSVAASMIPMRRAMRVDPVIAMRGD